jgi:hypothetical protein
MGVAEEARNILRWFRGAQPPPGEAAMADRIVAAMARACAEEEEPQ